MSAMVTLMVIAYPVVLHMGIRTGNIEFAVLLLAFLLSTQMLLDIIKRRLPGYKSVAGIVAAVVLLNLPPVHEETAVKIFPVVIFFSLFLLFAGSLRAGKTPLITRIAAKMRKGVVSEKVSRYTRTITLIWSLYFLAAALTALYLSIFSDMETWSIFANLFGYLLLILMFVIEFIFRSYYLRGEMSYNFFGYVKGLIRINYRDVFRP